MKAINGRSASGFRLVILCLLLVPHALSNTLAQDRGITTALHEAAATGNIIMLTALTETVTDLEVRNELGLTPLQVAVERGHLAAAALLVDKGANVNARDPEGNTLLHRFFVTRPRFEVIDRPRTNWLDRMGSDPRKAAYAKYLSIEPNEPRPSPLLQIASFLLASGIDAGATNQAGKSFDQLVLDQAARPGDYLFDDNLADLLKLAGTGGGNVNEADAEGNTALHRAGQDMLDNRIVALIASGADVNATNRLGRTPLHSFAERISAWDSHESDPHEPFQLLLKSKPNVNAQDNQGMTPLHVLAASESYFNQSATKALLAAGANPNLRDNRGRTPAVLFLNGKWPGNYAGECISLLVNAGASLSVKDDNGRTALHYLAAMGGQPLFFVRSITNKFATSKADLEARDNEGNTPLLIAARTGTHDVFDWLLKLGADLDATNNVGQTPRILTARNADPFSIMGQRSAETDIFQAVREGNIDAATRLLNADPHLANQTNQLSRQTPLHLAVDLCKTNMIALLEAHGAKWDEILAVRAGRADALQAILKANPSAITTTDFGKGPIHFAAANGDVAIVRMLIEANCDIQAVDFWGLTALGRAQLNHHDEVRELLLQHGARNNFFDAVYTHDLKTVATMLAQDHTLTTLRTQKNLSAMDIAAAAGYADILGLLLKEAARIDFDVPAGERTPVHMAAFHNQTNTLALLIRAGENVDHLDAYGFAPLHWASLRNATEAAAMLLDHAADINQPIEAIDPDIAIMMGRAGKDLNGDTPLHLAALCGNTSMVQLLLKSKADVNATNALSQTPLDRPDGSMPMTPTSIFMAQRGLLAVLEPLGMNQSPDPHFEAGRDGQKAAAALITAAGGRRNHPRLHGRSTRVPPN